MASREVTVNLTGTRSYEDMIIKLGAAKAVLADRERELLELKGPCSTCRLHYAHSGPCDIRPPAAEGSDG